MPNVSELDPRVAAGMRAQLSSRATKLAAGGKRLGWKAGFGAPAALAKFGLPGPLCGYMLGEARVVSGDEVSIAGWAKPVAEPEIAVYLGGDLADGRDPAAVNRAISGIGPAIELADLNPPPEDVTAILAGNIFHRRVLLGRVDTSRAGGVLDGIAGIVTRSGVKSAPVTGDALEANTGRVLCVVAHIATTLAACGERLQRGDVIICGSVIPPLFLEPGDTGVTFALEGIGEVSVRFATK
jgi:2-keto-4-pentenoate hydratase